MNHRKLFVSCGLAGVLLFIGGPARAGGEERGSAILEGILGGMGRDLSVVDPGVVEQVPNPWSEKGMDPVRVAKVMKNGRESGYLMWDASDAGKLVEFSLNRTETVADGHCLMGIPNLQQFGVAGETAPEVCSGCVPTAAANLVAYWSGHGLPQWGGFDDEMAPTDSELQGLAVRLRKLLKMSEIPDALGYTDDRRPLSGAMPEDLASALRRDAEAHGVKATVEFGRFSGDLLRREIAAGRPVLLSCVVRLPQKPQLSWGHELTGVGWVEIAGELYVAVHDNFYPAPGIDTRWIRSDAFDSMIVVVPGAG